MREWVRRFSPAVVTLAIAVPLSGILSPQSFEGLPSTPLSTLALLPVAKLALFASAAVTIGSLIIGFLLNDLERARKASGWAFGFAGASLLVLLLTLSDILAVSLWEVTDLEFVGSFITQIDEGRYLMLQTLLGVLAGWTARQLRSRVELTFALAIFAIAAVLPAFTGHSTANIEHWIVSSIMVVHLASMLAWVGGVVGLVWVGAPVTAVHSFNRLATAAFALIVVSGVASTFSRVGSWTDFWSDRYAAVLGAKVLLVLGIGALGFRIRKAVANAESALLKLLSVEGAMLLTVLALAVTLERMANP